VKRVKTSLSAFRVGVGYCSLGVAICCGMRLSTGVKRLRRLPYIKFCNVEAVLGITALDVRAELLLSWLASNMPESFARL
jgi:hypothetical protein